MKKMIGVIFLVLIFSFLASDSWPSAAIKTFKVATLNRAVKRHLSYELNESVVLTPLSSFISYTSEGKKFVLTLRFSSPHKIIGYSLYIYSTREFDVWFEHQDQWQSLWAEQPSAGDDVIDDFGGPSRFFKFNHCKLLGVMLQEPQNDLGDIVIETKAQNSFRFIFYTYILN